MDIARKGLFLDLDGTLADTLPVLKDAYHSFLARFACSGSEIEFAELNGPPLREVVAILKRTYQLVDDAEALLATYLDLIGSAHGAAPAAPGAASLLEAAVQRGRRVGVVTSCTRAVASDWLARNGFTQYVDTLVAGEDVPNGKPSADPYRAAVANAGCSVAESIAVEDSSAGARSAVAAGLQTWVVTQRRDGEWPPGVGLVRRLDELIPLL